MIGAHLAFHARRRPDSIAVVHNGVTLSYAQLEQDLTRISMGLRALGVEPQCRVALCVSDLFVFFLLILALDRLGCAIAPFTAAREPSSVHVPGGVEWAFTDFVPTDSNAACHHLVTHHWLQLLLNLPPVEARTPIEEGADDVVQILSTSGTTGQTKYLELTRRMMSERINGRIWQYGLAPSSRYLVAMPFTVASVYSASLAVLQTGGAVVFESRPLLESGTLDWITHTTLLPLHLRQLLDLMPPQFAKPSNLTVISLGARLPHVLAARALGRLAVDVIDGYGSNETGQIASMELAGPGLLLPWVEVRIVDEDGRDLPAGRPGLVAVRSPGMAHGYVGDQELSARVFRDGWFYPGDLAALHDGRRIELLGRADEVLNPGGQKLAPADLEELLQIVTGAQDVGVSTVSSASGIEQLAVALVGAVADQALLINQVRSTIGDAYGQVLIITLATLPRGPGGKIQRVELRRTLETILASSSAPVA